MYIGVHDSGKVQGIRFADRADVDKNFMAFREYFRDKICPPISKYYYSIEEVKLNSPVVDHAETTFESTDCKNCAKLTARVEELERSVRLYTGVEFAYVIVVTILPTEDSCLFQCDDKFYIRDVASTRHMDHDEIINRDRNVHLAKSTNPAVEVTELDDIKAQK